MSKITWYWNMVHYCVYLFFTNLFTLINYINPFYYLLKIPSVKRFYSKRGIDDMHELIKNAVDNPKAGINSIHSGGFMGGLVIFLLFGIINCSQLFFSASVGDWIFKNQTNDILFLLVLIVPSLLFNYYTLFKDNIYLNYIKEFDVMDNNEREKYYWMSLIVVVAIILFFIVSFKFTR